MIQTQDQTTTRRLLSDRLQAVPPPADPRSLEQFCLLQRYQQGTKALLEFLREHHRKLDGLSWTFVAFGAEVHVHLSQSDPSAREFAKRFPGPWNVRAPHLLGFPGWVDFVALREGVTIRLIGAERVECGGQGAPVTNF